MRDAPASIALLALLAACASGSADDISPEDRARLGAQDDPTCQDRGLAAGTEDYKACLSELQEGRAALSRPSAPSRSRVGGYGY